MSSAAVPDYVCQSVAKSFHEPLNIVVIRQRGRLLTFQVSGALLLILLIFGLVFIVAGLWGINRSLAATAHIWALEDENQRLRHELALQNARSAKPRHDQPVIISTPPLADLIPSDKKGNEPDSVPAAPPNPAPEPPPPPPAASLETLAAALPGLEPSEAPRLELLNPDVKMTDSRLTVSFTLQVQAAAGQSVQGSSWIWAEVEKDGQSLILSYPELDLKSAQPAAYQPGNPFSIRNNKPVRVTFQPVPEGSKVTKVMALVWSEQGRLWIKSELPLN